MMLLSYGTHCTIRAYNVKPKYMHMVYYKSLLIMKRTIKFTLIQLIS
jgi:hypothetical protein